MDEGFLGSHSITMQRWQEDRQETQAAQLNGGHLAKEPVRLLLPDPVQAQRGLFSSLPGRP